MSFLRRWEHKEGAFVLDPWKNHLVWGRKPNPKYKNDGTGLISFPHQPLVFSLVFSQEFHS